MTSAPSAVDIPGLDAASLDAASSDASSLDVQNLAADRASALTLTPVSRETLERLDRFVALLLSRQRRTNLVASSTLPHIWTRHVADSLQLLDLAPKGRVWIDVGSGAGFPGLVLACVLAGKPGAVVHLVESNAKKASFLREAVQLTGATAEVHCERIEAFAQRFHDRADVVCARAVAPLKQLINRCFPLLQKNGVTALFPKGQNARMEFDDAFGPSNSKPLRFEPLRSESLLFPVLNSKLLNLKPFRNSKSWKMTVTLVPSRTDPGSRIVVIRDCTPARAVHQNSSGS